MKMENEFDHNSDDEVELAHDMVPNQPKFDQAYNTFNGM